MAISRAVFRTITSTTSFSLSFPSGTQASVTPPTWMLTASTEQPVMASTAPMTAFWAFSATVGMGCGNVQAGNRVEFHFA